MTVNSWSKNFAFYLFHQTDFITVSFLFCFLYYQGFFSHTDTDNSQDSRGREGIIFYSTLPLPPAHKHWDNFTWSIFEYLSRIIIIQVTKHRSSNERVFFQEGALTILGNSEFSYWYSRHAASWKTTPAMLEFLLSDWTYGF